MSKYDVFISYSRKDSAVANEICNALTRAGISYFIDRKGISGGMEFPKIISESILDSKIFLYLASKNSYDSKFTNSEITFAFNKKNKGCLIPYKIDDTEMPLQQQFVFSNINWRNIVEHPIEPVLIQDLKNALGYIEQEFDTESEDITIAFEKENQLYLCIAKTGRKLKIDLNKFNGKKNGDFIKSISNLSILNDNKNSDTDSPGYHYAKNNSAILSNADNVYIICQPNEKSIVKAYDILNQCDSSKTRIFFANILHCLATLQKKNFKSYNGEINFGRIITTIEFEDGIMEVKTTTPDTQYSSVVTSDIIKGLLIYMGSILSRWLNDMLTLDIMGTDIKLCVGDTEYHVFDHDVTIPYKIRLPLDLKSGTILSIKTGSQELYRFMLQKDLSQISIWSDSTHNILIDDTIKITS